MSLYKKILFFSIIYLAIGLLFEAVFHLFPVQESMGWLPVNEKNDIRQVEPNREFTWSRNWNFRLVNHLRSNNYGFISPIDYAPSSTLPLTAVIGDSFIEAAMVDQQRTCVAELNKAFKDRRRFYAFAASGAQLSTYLAFARYAKREFRPDHYVFLLIFNDFDESLLAYGSYPGFHYFVEGADGQLTLTLVDYEVGLFRKLLRHSMLFMYINANLEFRTRLSLVRKRIKDAFSGGPPDAAEQTPEDARREVESKRAIDAFFKRLEEACGVPRKNILIAMDGMRPQLYHTEDKEKAEKSFHAQMRNHVLVKARQWGHPVIDMQPVFVQDFAANRLFFEYPQYNEWHWNERAHELFARQIVSLGFHDP